MLCLVAKWGFIQLSLPDNSLSQSQSQSQSRPQPKVIASSAPSSTDAAPAPQATASAQPSASNTPVAPPPPPALPKDSASSSAASSPALKIKVVDKVSKKPIKGAQVWLIYCPQPKAVYTTPHSLFTAEDGYAAFSPWIPGSASAETPLTLTNGDWAQVFVMAPGYYCRTEDPDQMATNPEIVIELRRDKALNYPIAQAIPMRPVPSLGSLTKVGHIEVMSPKVVTADPLTDLPLVVTSKHVIDAVTPGDWEVYHRFDNSRYEDDTRENGQVLIMHRNLSAAQLTEEQEMARLAKLKWDVQMTNIGGDSGTAGFFDHAHYADDRLVPPGFVIPAGFQGLGRWYSWLCDKLGDNEIILVPHGVLLHANAAMVAEGRDDKGLLKAVLIAE